MSRVEVMDDEDDGAEKPEAEASMDDVAQVQQASLQTIVSLSALVSVVQDVGAEVLAKERRHRHPSKIADAFLEALRPTEDDGEIEEEIRAFLRGFAIALIDEAEEAPAAPQEKRRKQSNGKR